MLAFASPSPARCAAPRRRSPQASASAHATSAPAQPRILITGGSIAGLATAVALRSRGFTDVKIAEGRPDHSSGTLKYKNPYKHVWGLVVHVLTVSSLFPRSQPHSLAIRRQATVYFLDPKRQQLPVRFLPIRIRHPFPERQSHSRASNYFKLLL